MLFVKLIVPIPCMQTNYVFVAYFLLLLFDGRLGEDIVFVFLDTLNFREFATGLDLVAPFRTTDLYFDFKKL